jgi:AraC family transcriptional regulator
MIERGAQMGDIVGQAVERVIKSMYDNLGEQLTIDDMARTALFSKFHFSRIFRQATGVSPARFLSAIRLQAAKRLLISTQLTVADISNMVGYSSVGTFSSRFKSSVGVAPTLYRQSGGYRTQIPTDDRRNGWGTSSMTVHGDVLPPAEGKAGLVFIGLFPEPIPQGLPIRCAVLGEPGPYQLEDVPQGTWYVLAHSSAPGDDSVLPDPLSDEQSSWVGVNGPLVVGTGPTVNPVDLQLRPMQVTDPPVLIALLDVPLGSLDASGI